MTFCYIKFCEIISCLICHLSRAFFLINVGKSGTKVIYLSGKPCNCMNWSTTIFSQMNYSCLFTNGILPMVECKLYWFLATNVAFKGPFMNDVDRIFTPLPSLTSLLHKLRNVLSLGLVDLLPLLLVHVVYEIPITLSHIVYNLANERTK